MKKLRKTLALLLCLALCLGLTPAAFAEEGAEELIVFDGEAWEDPGEEPAVEEPAADPADAAEDEPLFVFEEDPEAEPAESEDAEEPGEAEEPAKAEALDENATKIAVSSAHFPDAAFRAYVTGFDTDADGALSLLELTAVEEMDLRPYAGTLGNTKGIEYFTELRTLNASGLAFSAAVDLSRNVRLEALDCSYAAVNLILGAGSPLKSLNCEGADVTGLDLSALPALELFDCSGTALSGLDFSANTELRTLDISGTGLTGLDLSANRKLRELSCRGMQGELSELDVSGCAALLRLDCSENCISALRVGDALQELNCSGNRLAELSPEDWDALLTLDCSGNQLTALDLSGAPQLQTLNCSENRLTALDLSAAPQLLTLDCCYNQLAALSLQGCPALASLDCSNNPLAALDLSANTQLRGILAQSDAELVSVLLPENLESLPEGAFMCCTALAEIELPPSLRSIGAFAFYGCTALQALTLPAGLSEIGSCAFENCSGLRAVEIPAGVTQIPASAFAFCSALQSVSLPEGLTRIGKNAFDSCTALTAIALPASLRTVETEAFTGCSALKDVSFAGSEQQLQALDVQAGNEALARVLFPTRIEPEISIQPQDTVAIAGKTAVFTVTATGAAKYQWQYSTDGGKTWKRSPADGNRTAAVSVAAAVSKNGYRYRCVVSNGSGSVASDAAALTVITKPAITTQPKDLTAAPGDSVSFTVKASGGELSYQWQYSKNGGRSWGASPAAGNKTATLTVPVTAAKNGYQYRCKVTNAAGTAASEAAILTVAPRPVISAQPQDVTALPGTTVRFSLTATGADTYQWQYSKNGGASWANSPATGNKTATLSVAVTDAKNGYLYRCRLTNISGAVVSAAAALTVVPKPVIGAQPQDVTATAGTTAVFTISATGADSYQWQYSKNGGASWGASPADGNKTDTLSIPVFADKNGYLYRCRLTNKAGTVYSSAAELKVNIPISEDFFPDRMFRRIIKRFDTNGDGVFSNYEIADVTEIECYGNEIATLQGIEYFTALTLLDCSGNRLTSINVSRNTALTRLWCGENRLTSLDVSHNLALLQLSCNGNQLTSVDVSANTALTNLDCSYNKLTSLDVSRNLALTSLNCGFNELTSLDVSVNTALAYLHCSNNQLTSVDVSRNTALLQLTCGDNRLTRLDVSRNTALTSLSCCDNQLKSLDVSHNTELRYLGCDHNQLKSLDVSSCPVLSDLILTGTRSNSVTGSSAWLYRKNGNNILIVDKTVALTPADPRD